MGIIKCSDKKTLIYTIMYIVMGFSSMYYNSMYKSFEWPIWIFAHIPQAIFYTLGLYKIFILDYHQKKELLLIIIFAIINIITLFETNLEVAFLFFFFAIFAAKDVNYKLFIKYYFIFIVFLFIFIFLSSLVGIIPNLDQGGRKCFGIISPTDFGAYVFYFFLIYSFLTKKHRLSYIIIGFSLALFIIKFSRARLDFGMIIITIISILICDYNKKFFSNRIIKIAVIFSPIILILLTSVLTIMYNDTNIFILKIDRLLSGRIMLMNKAYNEYPITLFGQVLPLNGWGWSKNPIEGDFFFLDNYYSLSLYKFGLIQFIILWSIIILSLIYAYKINDIKMVIVFLMLSGTSFVDHHIIELSYNPFFVFSGLAIYDLLNSRDSKQITKS